MAEPDTNAGGGSSDAVIQTLKWVRKQGFKPVPLRKQSKAATNQNYVDLNYTPPPDDHWVSRDLGVGVVTGPSHAGPVDIDLDCPEAVFFASRFLPATAAVFGRPSKQRSHYLYRVELADGEEGLPKKAFNDPQIRGAGTTICEIRADGGHQTVFPGSIHETTGELIAWSDAPFPDVPRISSALLDFAVKKIAIATLIVRHMWMDGQRNEIIKHISGMFFYLEWPIEEVRTLVQAIMDYTGDDEKTRQMTLTSTYKKGEQGGKITGSNALREFMGDAKLVDRILEWSGNDTATMLQEYNERFACVSIEGKFRVAETTPQVPSGQPIFFSKDDFINYMGNDYLDDKPKPRIWLASPRRRQYRTIDFMPGEDDTPGTLNLWTGWGVKPEKKKSCQAWLDLLYYTICGAEDDYFNWMINWFANIVREPQNKLLTSPVITGKQGAGKSLLFVYFGEILGAGYLPVSNPEHIHGKFNKHLASTLLLHSEEALFAGDRRQAEIIKDLITGKTRIFEQKGIDAKNVKNFLRLAFTSNDPWAVRAEDGDRRYTIIDMDKRKVDTDRTKEVLAELKNGGPGALLYYLTESLAYKPELPRTNLKNEALLTLKEINFDPVSAWWFEVLKSGVLLPDYLYWAQKPERKEWPQIVSSVALYLAMTGKMKDLGQRYIPESTMFALRLNKMVGGKLDRKQMYYSNPCSDQAPVEIRRLQSKQSTITNMPGLIECRRAFVEFVGQPIEWPEDVPEEDKPMHERY